MSATLYRYGTPPSVRALYALMDEDAKHERWETYIADMLCINARLKSRKGSSIPMYSDIVGNRTRTDSRTGQEICDSVAEKLAKFAREATR